MVFVLVSGCLVVLCTLMVCFDLRIMVFVCLVW